jgi:hypothetical protein
MPVRTARKAGSEEGARGRGQALAEFALVIPIIVFVFMGVVEVALAFNATVGVNQASQNGAHLAAIMGNDQHADCLILHEIEADIYAPNDPSKIQEVIIERTAMEGNRSYAQQTYSRTGSMSCRLPGAALGDPLTVLPYTPTAQGYPWTHRCNILKGCTDPGLPDVGPDQTTVDNIGVSIRYRHLWATPLNAVLNVFAGGDVGWTIVQRNIFRIEPVL